MLKLFFSLWRKIRISTLPKVPPLEIELSDHEIFCKAILDPVYYLTTYPDIAAAGVDPLQHYTEIGYLEGRMPFSPQAIDAKAKLQKALKYKPDDPLFLEINFSVQLQIEVNGNLNSLETTLVFYKDKFSEIKNNARFIKIAEEAATVLYYRFITKEIYEKTAVVLSILNLFMQIFPNSQSIKSIIGLVKFNYSDLQGAEDILSSIEFEHTKPEITNICINVFKRLIEARIVNQKPFKSADLLFLDSSFPSKISSFRYGEFNEYLKHFQNSTIHILPDEQMLKLGEVMPFPKQVENYIEETGISPSRLRRFDSTNTGNPKLAYCVFLNLADYFYTDIRLPKKTDLIFTLYPGGTFAINEEKSNTKLQRLFDNPRLRKVITTQIVTYRYLLDGGFCSPDQLEHIYGGIAPSVFKETPKYQSSRPLDAPLNVCFVAHRYSLIGAEKGYDIFISVFRQFANCPNINFHVVGGYDADVIPIPKSNNITFYGCRNADFFDSFYRKMDLIISPNTQMSNLNKTICGYFDGFPLTTVIEAGLRGVAIFLTDFMKMNQRLDGSQIFDNNEMKIINRNSDQIAELIRYYMKDRQALIELGLAGRNAILREFSYEAQIKPRIRLIEKTLANY